jgi:hypothetical protein
MSDCMCELSGFCTVRNIALKPTLQTLCKRDKPRIDAMLANEAYVSPQAKAAATQTIRAKKVKHGRSSCSSCTGRSRAVPKHKRMSWVQRQAERLANLKQSAIDFWQDGMTLASEGQQRQRLNICKACPIYSDGWCDQDKGGCGCNVAMKVKARAAYCPAQKWHAHTDNYRPLVNPTRNLIFHIYPKLGAEWNWHKHIERICEYQYLFNGKICIGVVTGPGLASHAEVQQLMQGIRVTNWVLAKNAKVAETVTMLELLRLVKTDDPNTITLRGHCKGVTHRVDGIEQPWADIMWQACVDMPAVEDALASHVVAGALKCHEPLVPNQQLFWFFAGSFYWFRSDVFSRQWDTIRQNRWWIEAWPEHVAKNEEAACLFYDRMDRDIVSDWQTILTEYEFWKAAR